MGRGTRIYREERGEFVVPDDGVDVVSRWSRKDLIFLNEILFYSKN